MGLVRERGNLTPVIELQMWYPLLGYFNLSHSNVESNATFEPLWDKIYALNFKYRTNTVLQKYVYVIYIIYSVAWYPIKTQLQ